MTSRPDEWIPFIILLSRPPPNGEANQKEDNATKAINNNQRNDQGRSAEFETESKPKSNNHETTENTSGDIPDAQN